MRKLCGAGLRALRAILIAVSLGVWLDAGASAAMRHLAAGHCTEAGQASHHAGAAIAISGSDSDQGCGGLPCPMVRHCGTSVNGTLAFDRAQGPSLTPLSDAGPPIAFLWMPRTRHIAPPTPPPLAPLDLTA
jgi:hypothetical protein